MTMKNIALGLAAAMMMGAPATAGITDYPMKIETPMKQWVIGCTKINMVNEYGMFPHGFTDQEIPVSGLDALDEEFSDAFDAMFPKRSGIEDGSTDFFEAMELVMDDVNSGGYWKRKNLAATMMVAPHVYNCIKEYME